MANKRLAIIKDVGILAITDEAKDLAKTLLIKKAVPENAAADALHIAVASVEKIDFLATWNFKHIANAKMQVKIEEAIRAAGYEPSHICTLEELSGE